MMRTLRKHSKRQLRSPKNTLYIYRRFQSFDPISRHAAVSAIGNGREAAL
jgi:hypothetical protein